MSSQGYSGYSLAQYGEPDRRPAKVTVLAILAILFGALASLGGMLSLVLVSALDAAEDLDLAFGTLRLLAVWSLLAGAAEVFGGVFALQGRNWARLLLTAVFAVGILVNVYSLVGGSGAGTSIFGIAVGGAVIALLWQRDSTAWFTRDSRPLLPGQYPGLQYPGEYPGQYLGQYPAQYPGQQP